MTRISKEKHKQNYSINFSKNQKPTAKGSWSHKVTVHNKWSEMTECVKKVGNKALSILKKFSEFISDPRKVKAFISHKAKLVTMAGAHLGWSIYHLYLRTCEFPGRVEAVSVNVGNLQEAAKNKDVEEAKILLTQAQSIKDKDIKFDEDRKLQGRNIHGVCLGSVMHLFEEYHSSDEQSSDHFINLVDFSKGAPSKAVANQIVGEAATFHSTRKRMNPIANKFYNKDYDNLTTDEQARIQVHMKERSLFQLRGLDLESPPIVKTNDETLLNLAPGTYYLGIKTNSIDHAIGYVKHADGTGHIFDPNKGFIKCHSSPPTDHAKQLRKMINCYTPLSKDSSTVSIEIKKVIPKNEAQS